MGRFLATYFLHSSLWLTGAWILWKLMGCKHPERVEGGLRLALFGGLLTAGLQLVVQREPLLGRIPLAFLETHETKRSEDPLAYDSKPREASALFECFSALPESERDLRHSVTTHETTLAHALTPATKTLKDVDPRSLETRASSRAPRRQSTFGEPRRKSKVLEDSPIGSALGIVPAKAPIPSSIAPDVDAASDAGTGHGAYGTLQPKDAGSSLSATGLTIAPKELFAALLASAFLLALFWIGVTWLVCKRSLVRRRLLTEGPLLESLTRLKRKAGITFPVRLSISKELQSPVSLGWWRPEIVVPERALEELAPEQAHAMLAHELAHAQRRDALWFQLYFLFERLFFFQPLNRLARRRLVHTAELACDDQAIRWSAAPLSLASCLTTVAGWHVRRESFPLPSMSATRSALSERVHRLLGNENRNAQTKPKGVRALFSLAGSLFTVGCVSWIAPSALANPEQSPSEEKPWGEENSADREDDRREERSASEPHPAPAQVVLAEPKPRTRSPLRAHQESGLSEIDALQEAFQTELSALEVELIQLDSLLSAKRGNLRQESALQTMKAKLERLKTDARKLEQLMARLKTNRSAPQ